MSLLTDTIFYNALMADTSIVTITGGRIYSTAVPCPDEQLDNVPVPYVIITYDGMVNEGFTKDDSFEGTLDRVTIGILAVAADRESLGKLLSKIRQQVENYLLQVEPTDSDADLVPASYQITANEIQYDSVKPCYFQSLQYECDTNP